MKKQLTFILLAVISFVASAQNEGEITGKLTDSLTGEPIPFAYMILSSNSRTVMQVMSDDEGLYTFKPVLPGTYDIEIRAFSYDTLIVRNIIVASRGLTVQNFEIPEGMLEELIIKPSLIDTDNPTVEATFDEEDIGNMPVTTIQDVAILAPQVQSNEQTGGLYIAGSREDATLYVVDGVKVIGSLYLPMKAIKEINVITGGIPANYGDVTGGIIEITTKSYSGFF